MRANLSPLLVIFSHRTLIGGIALFALWAGILATTFAEEMRRRNFLKTWDLVARVPYFSGLGAGYIPGTPRWRNRPPTPVTSRVSSDAERCRLRYSWQQANPALRLGRPTYGWLDAALGLSVRTGAPTPPPSLEDVLARTTPPPEQPTTTIVTHRFHWVPAQRR